MWLQEAPSTSTEGARRRHGQAKPDPARWQDIGMEEHLLSHRATVCL